MKYKKSLLIICLIVCFFSITSVCASGVNGAMVANEVQNDVLSVENNQIILENASDVGSSDELSNLIENSSEGAILELDKDYKSVSGSNEGIQINKPITIDGKGHDINSTASISGNNVILKNINFNKREIEWKGNNGIMINCTLSGCSLSSHGAMLIIGANMTIINSTFSSNTIKAYEYGGAISWFGINGKVINSTFIKNKNLYYYGGAIHWKGSNAYILKCTFLDSYAEEYGGAVYGNEKCDMKIYDSTFINNRAKRFGGALHVRDNLDLNNCTFIKNQAKRTAAVSATSSKSIVNCSLFYMNEATGDSITDAGICSANNIINSIFLNNTAKSLVPDKCTVDYNWYGSTLDDYLIKPTYSNALTKWLFLNATHEQLMLVGEEIHIPFVFQVWDGTNVSDYDSSKVYPVKLNLSAANGEINKISSVVGEDILFKASAVGNGSITANFFDKQLTINLICKYPAEIITCNPITIYVDQVIEFNSDKFNITLVKPKNGDLSYSTDNQNILKINSTGFKGINAGKANIIVESIETDEFAPTHISIPITVKKYDTKILFDDSITMNYGESKTIVPILNPNVGNLLFTSNNLNIATITNGGLIKAVNAGTTNIQVTFEGNRKYESSYKTITLKVNKVDSTINVNDIEYNYGKSGHTSLKFNGASKINAFVVNFPKANVYINYNTIYVSELDAGDYVLSVTTVPDSNHNAVTVNKNIKVNKVDSSITIPIVEYTYGQSGSVQVDLNGANSITNVCIINHPEAIIDVKNNLITISGLDIGTYTLSATTIPDSNHNAVTKTTNVIVKKRDSTISFTNEIIFNYNGSASTTAIIEDASGITNVRVVNHPEAIIKVNNNVITVSNLAAGVYTLTATTIPHDAYNAVSASTKVIVNKVNSIFKPKKDVAFNYGGSNFNSLMTDGISGIKAHVVNHPEANIKYNKGVLFISNLNAGNYKLSVTTVPDSNHNKITTSIPFTVKKTNPKIIVKKIKGKTTLSVLKATVKDSKGKLVNQGIVKFSINGKSYKVNVHKGIAKKNLKFTKAKTYSYKATFSSRNYNSKSASSKLIVKQAKVKITAIRSSAISGEYVMLSAFVQDTNGRPMDEGSVKFKINGKSYKVKVKNGAAIKKLKLHKAKTYKYKATFSSKYYASKTSTSKVVIKKQPVFTVKIGKYSIKVNYKEYKKIIKAQSEGHYIKQFDTGKKVNYKIYTDKKITKFKKKLYSYGTYTTYYINNPDALIAPSGYVYVGKEFTTENGIEKVYFVYKKVTFKKVFVGTKKTKMYISIESTPWHTTAKLYHLEYAYDGEYGYYISKPKHIF